MMIRRKSLCMMLVMMMIFGLCAPATTAGAAAADAELPIPSSGLNLWLKADAGVTMDEQNKVSAWADQSGQGNHVTQGDPNAQPLLVTDAINNLPAIQFKEGIGNTPFLSKTLDTPYVGSSSIVLVMKQNVLSPGNGKGIFGTDVFQGQDMAGAFGVITDWQEGGLLLGGEQGNANVAPASTDYAIVIITIDTDTGTVKSYVNGELVASSTRDTNKLFQKYAAYALGRSYWHNSLNANLSEIAVYRMVLSDAERQSIEQYASGKYAITLKQGAEPEPTPTPLPTPNPTSAPAISMFNAQTSFNGVQGTDGWYYMKKDKKTYSYLHEYQPTAPGQWKDSSGVYVTDTLFHPDRNDDAVKKWVAPRAGNVSITGQLLLVGSSSKGKGLEAHIYKNTELLWDEKVKSDKDEKLKKLSDIHVEAGDVLYFVVSASVNGKDQDRDDGVEKDTVAYWVPEIMLQSKLTLQAESYSSISEAVKVASTDSGGGEDIQELGAGDYVVYKNVNLSGGYKTLEARLSSTSTGGRFEVRLDSLEGPVISTFTVANTDGWENYETQVWAVDPKATGVHDIYIKAVSGTDIAKINWFQLTSNEARGATMPYTTYEAEDGKLGGGASLNDDPIVKVTSSRKSYVHLDQTGEYVEWKNVRDADRLLLRYSIPKDTAGSISLYINGKKTNALALTSTYNYDTENPDVFKRRFDEKDYIVEIHAGDTIKLQKDADDALAWYGIDLIDLETAPTTISKPDNYISVKDAPFFAVGDGVADDTRAIQQAVNAAAAQKKGVYIPAGTYNQSDRIIVPSGVNIQGAGMWYTHLHSTVSVPETIWGGKVGFTISNQTVISDLRISGIETKRNGESAIAIQTKSGQGYNNTLQYIWAEHIGCLEGWTDWSNSLIQHVRIRDTYFDGIHLGDGRNANNIIHNNSMRGLGDDAVAQVNLMNFNAISERNVAQFNTISALYWGRGMSDVGGNSLIYRDNLIDSTYNAGMIITTEPVAANADSYTIDGLKFQRNSITNSGHAGHNHAGLHFWLYVNPMKDVRIELNTIQYGETEGIHIDDTNFGDAQGRTQFNYNIVTNNALNNYTNASQLIEPILNGNTGF